MKGIGARLTMAGAVSGAMFVGSVLIAILGLHSSKTTFRYYSEIEAPQLVVYTRLYANGLQTGAAIRNIILNPKDPKAYQNYDAAVKEFDETLHEGFRLTERSPERQSFL